MRTFLEPDAPARSELSLAGASGSRKEWFGAANIGSNPTFGENARKIEVHLIGFSGDVYGAMMEVEFVARLRDTRPFNGVNELVAQLKQDIEQASRVLQVGRL